jgi:hypothetical protein
VQYVSSEVYIECLKAKVFNISVLIQGQETLVGIIGVMREILQEMFVRMTDIMARIFVADIQQ